MKAEIIENYIHRRKVRIMKRNGKVFKKTLGIVLSAAMLVSGMTFMPGSAVKVQAAATTKDVNLGFGGISDPTSTESSATAWTGSKVYYGDKLWRVLDDSGFLFSEDLLETKAYHDTFSGITWENCTLRSYLNGQTFLNSNFTGTEQDAIKDTSVTNDSNPDYSTAGGNNTTDKLFLLSLAEVRNTDYGFGSDATRAASSWWWLRSPGIHDFSAADVNYDGSVDGYGVNDDDGSVRPALNLNLSSVLFTSASGASKSSFGVVGDSNVSNNTWKLTLEGTENTLGANKTNGKTSLTAGYSAENLIISHSAATTLTDATQVSAMLTDSYGTVLYYGSVNSDTTATSSTVTIPAGLAVGTYSLYVFAEDVNTGNLTDYATALGTAISINVNAAPSTYAVTVNNGTGDGNYEENATVTITADAAPSGKVFDKWVVKSGKVTLASAISTTTTFTMPASAVEITATYKDKTTEPTTKTYTITYQLNKGTNNKSNPSSYTAGKAVSLNNPTRKGYTFKGWYTDSKFKSKITSIPMGSKKNYTVYAKWDKVSVKKAQTPKLSNVKGKKLIVKYAKTTGVKGYEITYATNSKFTKGKKVITTTKTSKTFTKLKKGKTYYVRVRAYKVDSTGKKVYGKYSSVKKIKIKK